MLLHEVMVLIISLCSSLYLPPSIVTGHYREILIGVAVTCSYFIFRCTSPPVVMQTSEYTRASICYQLMNTILVFVNVPVLIVMYIRNCPLSL